MVLWPANPWKVAKDYINVQIKKTSRLIARFSGRLPGSPVTPSVEWSVKGFPEGVFKTLMIKTTQFSSKY